MTWTAQIFLKPEVDRARIREICKDIEEKDSSFEWEIEGDYLKVYGGYNEVHKEALWLVNNVKELKEANSGYDVKKVE